MRKVFLRGLVIGVAGAAGGAATAQSPDYMTEDCRLASRQFYQDFEARTEASYEGQRTDGTHAVNGTIYLETSGPSFSCSYNADGDTLVDFVAEGRSWPDFVRGEGSPYGTGGAASSTASSPAPASSVSTERVRFPAGTSAFRFPAQLPPGMTVRYLLGASNGQFLDVGFSPADAPLAYRILNPDGSALLDEIPVGTPYRGQLWQSGDHVVEVANRTGSTVPFEIGIRID